MCINRLAGIAILILALMMGCSGDAARIKTLPANESKVTQQELFDNWSNYTIYLRATVAVFDPKDDNRKILVGGNWTTVKDQAAWSQIVEANTTSKGDINPVRADYSMSGVREIWSHDNQLFGYIIHQQRDLVSARLVDENTMRVWHSRARMGGP